MLVRTTGRPVTSTFTSAGAGCAAIQSVTALSALLKSAWLVSASSMATATTARATVLADQAPTQDGHLGHGLLERVDLCLIGLVAGDQGRQVAHARRALAERGESQREQLRRRSDHVRQRGHHVGIVLQRIRLGFEGVERELGVLGTRARLRKRRARQALDPLDVRHLGHGFAERVHVAERGLGDHVARRLDQDRQHVVGAAEAGAEVVRICSWSDVGRGEERARRRDLLPAYAGPPPTPPSAVRPALSAAGGVRVPSE